MSTAQADGYALGRTPEEYERLRARRASGRRPPGACSTRSALAAGASCLDAGCGPGETMRLMASGSGRRAASSASTSTNRSAGGARAPARRGPSPSARSQRHDVAADDADPRRALRPRLRAAAALPSARAGRGAGAAVGRGRPGRPSARPGLRPARPSVCFRRSPASRSSARVLIGAFTAAGCRRAAPARGCPSSSRRPVSASPTAPTSPAGSSRSRRPRAPRERAAQRAADRVDPRRHHRERRRGDPVGRSAATPRGSPTGPMLWPLMIGAWKRRDSAARPRA